MAQEGFDTLMQLTESRYQLSMITARRAAIYEVIADLARAGMAVLVVSSDLEEVLGLAHRVMILARGRQMGVLDRERASNVAVMELATA